MAAGNKRKSKKRGSYSSAKQEIVDSGDTPDDALSASTSNVNAIRFGNRVFRVSKGKKKRNLDIRPDMPDIRDRPYQPHLRALQPAIYPRISFPIRNQGADMSCTGFSLAHLIDFLRHREDGPDNPEPVSARMLYEMAKRNDEWAGSAYEGSSPRGAIKGFFRNGVCSDRLAPDQPNVTNWALTYEMAKEAREIRLGAYYRVQPDISDYHAAINEVGAIYVSAQVHTNWDNPVNGRIEPGGRPDGGHAFVIVGYDHEGFWVLNSWGEEWGTSGVAHWRYSDWAATIMDAWVLQLGVRAPDAFSAKPRGALSGSSTAVGGSEPQRGDIIGHFINIDDGLLVETGKYGSPKTNEMKETVDRLTSATSNDGKGYDHLIIYAHGGLNDLGAEAARIATWKRNKIFSRNRLYNFHLMWGSGFLDEAFGEISKSHSGKAGGIISDLIFEVGIGKMLGSRAWKNMKQDGNAAFAGDDSGYDGGYNGLAPLIKGLDKADKKPIIHLVGHSAGSIVLGYLLSALGRFKIKNLELGSIHLLAPACTTDFFETHYTRFLQGKGALKLKDKIYLYGMTDQQELDDEVAASSVPWPRYERSLLYLVSRAYEEVANTPIAGMKIFHDKLPSHLKLQISLSSATSSDTRSTTHGGFDNDATTLGRVMSRILGGAVPYPPRPDELVGY